MPPHLKESPKRPSGHWWYCRFKNSSVAPKSSKVLYRTIIVMLIFGLHSKGKPFESRYMQHLHQTAPRQPPLVPPFASVSHLEEGNERNIVIGRLSIRLTPFLQNKSGDKRLLSATFDVMRHLIRRKKTKKKGQGRRRTWVR